MVYDIIIPCALIIFAVAALINPDARGPTDPLELHSRRKWVRIAAVVGILVCMIQLLGNLRSR